MHPLHPLLLSAACHKVTHHLSLHHLLCFTCINPKEVETILLVRRWPGYIPSFKTVIPSDNDEALSLVVITNKMAPVHVYTDGSWLKGGIEAAALLYIRECLVKML
jgi:hypothetical protein